MSSFIPITLVGDNLGKRHQYLNSLVNEAFQQDIPFQCVQDVPEQSAVDRLFKIDLANKQKNVVYIIRNLKDDDMLYVSRALKCLWLLESQYSNIINPTYLEDVLFPEMTATAVNKMKHWLQSHLRNTQRCEQFYTYFSKIDFATAIKFFWHCSNDFILSELVNVLHELTPKHLKRLSEKCPQVTKIYYDNLQKDKIVASSYLNNEMKYYNSLKCLLKLNAGLFLDIIEKYFNKSTFNSLSSIATKYILKNHKDRFMKKPELYTAWLLNIKTLAKYLSSEEIKEVILKLARAEYLSSWFKYKNVEPLIKRLGLEERTLFKKQVFVNKCFGETVTEWPYPVPFPPEVKNDSGTHVFLDKEYEPSQCYIKRKKLCKRAIRKKKGCAMEMEAVCLNSRRQATLLDRLFEQYRFASFEHTLFMLRKQMAAESSAQNRQYIMLVLVSKSGGRAEALETLLRLLVERHGNEPATLRAAVVRSLVRRAGAWRLPPAAWDLLLRVGRDLGLDGAPPAAACREGLHAVVLRNILQDVEIEPSVWKAFLNEFSSLDEYPLTAAERRCVRERLPALLLAAAESEPDAALVRLDMLLDVLDTYRLRVTDCPGVVSAIATSAHNDPDAARPLLQRMYDARVARRELFRENFEFIQSNSSYLNALRHDAVLVGTGERFVAAVTEYTWWHKRYDQFLRKVRLYFGEDGGLAGQLLKSVECAMAAELHISLARPLALLAGGWLEARLRDLDEAPVWKEMWAEAGNRRGRFASALRANAHAARPPLDVDAFGWRAAGAKAVANAVCVCRAGSLRRRVRELLAWRRTARLALALALRARDEAPTFAAVAALHPSAALKAALRYFRRRGDEADPRVWDAVKPLILRFDFFTNDREILRRTLTDTNSIPTYMKVDYSITVFKKIRISRDEALPILSCLETFLPELDETFIRNVIESFICDDLTPEKLSDDYDYVKWSYINIKIIAKFLLLSECEMAQTNRSETICQPFLNRMENLWNSINHRKVIMAFLDVFMSNLKYSEVFLDVKYVPCLPVFEKIIKWMQKLLPLEEWFGKYVSIHLTMLYFKSIRQSIKQRPEVFEIETRKRNEGVEVVGTVFGKYIAHEVDQLMTKYFMSIREMYKTELLDYMNNYFNIDKSRNQFSKAIIRGILEECHGNESQLLAEYVLENEMVNYDKSDKNEILKIVMETRHQDIFFFIHANEILVI